MRPWENNVRKVIPYVPGEQPKQEDMVKLNTNENPYPPSTRVQETLTNMDVKKLRLYPDPKAEKLVETLAETYHVEKEQVFVGVGSDDVLAMCFMTFFNSSKPILFPDITYSFYDVWADLLQIPYIRQPLDQNFHIDKNDYIKPNGGIIFPNPNAPTGVEMSQEDIEEILAQNEDSVVIVDEAYVDFGAKSALPLIDKYDNLLVVQTFSKSRSLAGMRIGFAMGDAKLIKFLNDVKYSFNSYTMDRTAIELGVAALADEEYFRETMNKITETRAWTENALTELGFTFPESVANFLFVTHKDVAAKELFEAMRDVHIYVRYFNKPRIDNYLRITIGTQEEMEKLVAFLKAYLNK